MLKIELNKLKEISYQYGSSLAEFYQSQRTFSSQITNDNLISKDNHLLNLSMGLYDKISFCNYLGKNNSFEIDESIFYKIDK